MKAMRFIRIHKQPQTLKDMLARTVQNHRRVLAFSFVDKSVSYTYGEFQKKIDELSNLFVQYGFKKHEHIALLSQNMPNWPVAYFSMVTTNHVVVPLLTELSPSEIETVLLHSETRGIFVSRRLYAKLTEKIIDRMTLIVCVDDFSILKGKLVNFEGENTEPMPDDLAALIYTSGTTGTPKGVMLTHKNICSSAYSGYRLQPINPKDTWLSILPLAHTYEATISMMMPVLAGGTVYYISKLPTPQILFDSIKKIRPHIILSVPLVIEKIVKKFNAEIKKRLDKKTWLKKFSLTFPNLFHLFVQSKFTKLFGGRLFFFGIGGAKLNGDTEQFLADMNFPYAIGYGLTEAAPLICGCGPYHTRVGSMGTPMSGVSVKLIDVDPVTGEGEIVAKGDNIMKGYYKNPQATKAAFTEDGWFKTNDLCFVDENGWYYHKGRLNNVVVGASGENIYLEDVEQLINANEEVDESLVVMKQGKLTALIKYRDDILATLQKGTDEAKEKLDALSKAILQRVNAKLSAASQVYNVEIQWNPFIKTATHKIKRFMYQ